MYLAHVIARQGKTFIVEDEHGEQHACHARSKSVDAMCGDNVECEKKDQSTYTKNEQLHLNNLKYQQVLNPQ